MALDSFKLFILLIHLLLPLAHGASKELNVSLAEVLCNVSCSFFEPLIWENEMVPQDDDDVLITYTVSANRPITLNLDAPITLNDMDIYGNVALYVNASSFTVKSVKLIGGDYTTQIQLNYSEVTMRSLVVDNADFLSTNSDVTLDNLSVTNVSSLVLVDTDLFCATCHMLDTTVDESSTFTGIDVTLWSPQTTFKGFTNITNLVVDSRAVFYNALLNNVTIQLNANIFAHGMLQIGQVTLMELSMIVVFNATYVNIAPYSSSRVIGQGSFVFTLTSNFSFGNPDISLDLTSCEVQLFEGNVGTFINVAFGTLLVNAPAAVVLLSLTQVTFTQPTVLFGNITATGLSVQKTLTVLGSIICEGGVTSVSGQLTSTEFQQLGGAMELSGLLATEQLINCTNVNFTTVTQSKITGDVSFVNSTVNVYQPLIVLGDWRSDVNTEIVLPSLTPNLPPRLNVSGNIYINSTVTFALSQTPSSRAEYPLFTYGGTIKGDFASNFTTPSAAHGDFTLQYTDFSVILIYTPHAKDISFFSPGPPLYGAIAGIGALIVVLIIAAVVIRRMFTQRHRQYEVIPS